MSIGNGETPDLGWDPTVPAIDQRQSGITPAKTPDGMSSEVTPATPERVHPFSEEAAHSKVVTLQKMFEIIAPDLGKRPGDAQEIQDLKTSQSSYEYTSSSLINRAKDPEIKAQLVQVWVNRSLTYGFRSSAIHDLAYANAAELHLPEFNDQFLIDQYQASITDRDFRDAWSIAKSVSKDRAVMVKGGQGETNEGSQVQLQEYWKAQEKESFRLHAEDILTRFVEDKSDQVTGELRSLFDDFRFREDGFESSEPNELGRRVAEAVIAIDRSYPGGEWRALQDAAAARLPEEYIVKLRRELQPSAVDQFVGFMTRVQKYFSKE